MQKDIVSINLSSGFVLPIEQLRCNKTWQSSLAYSHHPLIIISNMTLIMSDWWVIIIHQNILWPLKAQITRTIGEKIKCDLSRKKQKQLQLNEIHSILFRNKPRVSACARRDSLLLEDYLFKTFTKASWRVCIVQLWESGAT